MVSVRDPLGGEHDAKLGIEGEALHWTTAGPVSEALLGAGRPPSPAAKANRWEAQATWTWTRPLLRERDTLYNDGATRGYAHSGRVWAFWDLPTDPWTQSIGLTGDVHMDPLGTATPIGNPDKARLGGGARLQQTIDVRIGELVVDASLSHWAELADRRPLNEVLQVDEPLPDLPGSGGLRWRVGLEYAF